MDVEYIIRGYYDRGKLLSIKVANMDIIYWSVCLSSRRGGDKVKGVNGGIVILACYKFNFLKT